MVQLRDLWNKCYHSVSVSFVADYSFLIKHFNLIDYYFNKHPEAQK